MCDYENKLIEIDGNKVKITNNKNSTKFSNFDTSKKNTIALNAEEIALYGVNIPSEITLDINAKKIAVVKTTIGENTQLDLTNCDSVFLFQNGSSDNIILSKDARCFGEGCDFITRVVLPSCSNRERTS